MSTVILIDTALEDAAEEAAKRIVEIGREAAARGWVPATSGNFSLRVGDRFAITRSGRDKGRLVPDDVALVPLHGTLPAGLSAEAPLHLARYRADAAVGAVLHVHSPAAALVSRRFEAAGEIVLEGWELQKAIAGVTTHQSALHLPVFANSQDVPTLAAEVEARLFALHGTPLAPGYLLAGHGLYAWGTTADQAWRHLEALGELLTLQLAWNDTRTSTP